MWREIFMSKTLWFFAGLTGLAVLLELLDRNHVVAHWFMRGPHY
jgi:hypothetical protein